MILNPSKEVGFYRPKHGQQSGLACVQDSSLSSVELENQIYREVETALLKIGFDGRRYVEAARASARTRAFDASLQPDITTPSSPTPIQFLQAWLPGFIHTITAPRNIDILVGRTTLGSWSDQQIVFSIRELTGKAREYGDFTNIPFTSWNVNQIARTIVRQEAGIEVGRLESEIAAKINLDDAAEKRSAAALVLEIVRNAIGFFGYNNGINLTYGFLNDPNELPYTVVPVGASGFTEWEKKTASEIIGDLLLFLSTLRSQTKGFINPKTTKLTMAVATAVIDYLAVPTDLVTFTPLTWLKDNYPNIRIENAPELDGANGGENVAYVYADRVEDTSTDDRAAFIQAVPNLFMALGVEMKSKEYIEDYTNAMAGVSIKRPYALTRWSGI